MDTMSETGFQVYRNLVYETPKFIDFWQAATPLDEIKRCKDIGLSGIGELNPARQQFFANDVRFYPLWEECAKLGLPILFHGGMAAAGESVTLTLTAAGSGIADMSGNALAANAAGLKNHTQLAHGVVGMAL